jgi:hypothetical protein
VNEEPLEWKIQALRGQIVDLGSAIRLLNQSGFDSATAQILLSRKRTELDDLMNEARRNNWRPLQE